MLCVVCVCVVCVVCVCVLCVVCVCVVCVCVCVFLQSEMHYGVLQLLLCLSDQPTSSEWTPAHGEAPAQGN